MKFEELKTKAQPFLSKTKELGTMAFNYVKENPRDAAYDVAAFAIAVALLDIDDALEAIEDSTAVSAAVDLNSYWNS
mgnify:FL=1